MDAMDLRGGAPEDWLVVGWFTPDYRAHAERFASNLDNFCIPYHLLAMEKEGDDWDTRQKAAVALECMTGYMGKTLILMDVDCRVKGDISPLVKTKADVGLTLRMRPRNRKGGVGGIVFTASSRVVVLRATPGARRFCEEWDRLCYIMEDEADETAMAWAFMYCSDVSYVQLPTRYCGAELSRAEPDAVITHESIHAKGSFPIRYALKSFRRKVFGSGWTTSPGPKRVAA